MTEYVFVDTDILVYAHGVGDADPRAVRARAVLGELWRTESGVLSTQVLQEFYSVATRRLKLEPKHARGIVASYAEWCTVNTDVGLIVSGSRSTEEHSISFWDALVIEAALRANASKLLSEDLRHGRKFGELVVENPFDSRGA
ncbi:MAG TPA: PIN domain-containing protein [Pseudonocardiaceae bacterium]|nr:PIN domain-containing protein [Pseudonocardiaceae bacterium]